MSPKYNCAKLRFSNNKCAAKLRFPSTFPFFKTGKHNVDKRNTFKQTFNLKHNSYVDRPLHRGSTSWRPNKRRFVHRRNACSRQRREFHFHLYHLNRTALLLGSSNLKTGRYDQDRKCSKDSTRRAFQRPKRRYFRNHDLHRSSPSPLRGVWT